MTGFSFWLKIQLLAMVVGEPKTGAQKKGLSTRNERPFWRGIQEKLKAPSKRRGLSYTCTTHAPHLPEEMYFCRN
jgi:hypothetical protein